MGGIILDNAAAASVQDLLTATDFSDPKIGAMYATAIAMLDRGLPVDEVTLTSELRSTGRLADVGGAVGVTMLVERIPTAANIRTYAEIVRKASERRRLHAMARALTAQLQDPDAEPADAVERFDRQCRELLARGSSEPRHIQALYANVLKRAEALQSAGGPIGILSRIEALDRLTGGWQPGRVYVLAARPRVGKTALAINFIEAATRDQHRTLMFSLEMEGEQIAQRHSSMVTGVSSTSIEAGKLELGAWQALTEAMRRAGEWPLWIDDEPIVTIRDVWSRARRHQSRHGLDLLALDYVQMISSLRERGRGETRDMEITGWMKDLKALAKRLRVPILLLAQVGRGAEKRADQRPQLSDLRESGGIEAFADVVMFLHRDALYNEDADPTDAELIVAKNRGGPEGTVELSWDGATQRFRTYRPPVSATMQPPPHHLDELPDE